MKAFKISKTEILLYSIHKMAIMSLQQNTTKVFLPLNSIKYNTFLIQCENVRHPERNSRKLL